MIFNIIVRAFCLAYIWKSNFQMSRVLRSVASAVQLSREGSKKLESWGRPLKLIFEDYKSVTKDTLLHLKEHPFKSTVYFLGIGSALAAWSQRPDYESYTNAVIKYSNEICQCSELTRKPSAHRHITETIHLQSDSYLQYVNLGVVGIVIKRNYPAEVKIYNETCGHIQPHWWTVFSRIVDIGFWRKWYVLEKKMADFDVNDEV